MLNCKRKTIIWETFLALGSKSRFWDMPALGLKSKKGDRFSIQKTMKIWGSKTGQI
mgnify:CR=1 FL=1